MNGTDWLIPFQALANSRLNPQIILIPGISKRIAPFFLGIALFLGACGPRAAPFGGTLAVRSQSEAGVSLHGGFTSALYGFDDRQNLVVLLREGPDDEPVQVATIRMFWVPRAGRTPIDATATNATIRYVIFTGEEKNQVGIYSGAGFLYPENKPGSNTLKASVWEATLRIQDRSPRFRDLLGQAVLEGRFTARRDDAQVASHLNQLNRRLYERLGHSKIVQSE